MKLKLPRFLILAFAVSMALPVYSDTLKLKDGKAIIGTFKSGNSQLLVFATVDGHSMSYALKYVDSVYFAPLPEPPKTAPAAGTLITIPAGTQLLVRTVDALDTSKTDAGQRFAVSLDANLAANGVVVARKGTMLYGKVLESNSAGRAVGKSKMTIQLTEIVIDGTAMPIMTDTFDTEGKSSGKRTAKRTLAGAGLGAMIGGIGGNAGKGAAIGATTGVVMSVVQKGDQVQIPSESLLEFRLQQPVTLPIAN
jgi:hypothetical protein